MAVFVDRCIWEWRGRRWCHLISDVSYHELHEFAQRLGIPRRAFQGDHYDLHEDLRALAIDDGAVEVDGREVIARLRRSGLRLTPTRRRAWRHESVHGFGLDHVTLRVYDDRWADYEAARPAVHGARAAAFASRCIPGYAVADLGCGPGVYTPLLPVPTIGLDRSAAMLTRANEAVSGGCWVQADLEDLPFAPASLGGAWSRNGHVHIPSRRLPWALAQLHRAMLPGSPLFLSVVAGDGDGRSGPTDDLPGRFFARWSVDRLRDVVVGAGFTIDELALPERDRQPIIVSATRARTLPDTVGGAMRLLVCGLNPSLVAADAGVGFAGATNRFWKAAQRAGLVARTHDAQHALLECGIGMTDLVKRATPRSAEVTVDEYRDGLARVERMVSWLRPGAVCFVGLEGYRATYRGATVGWQPQLIGGRPAYVMGSTSGLNAHESIDSLSTHLRLAALGPLQRKTGQ